MTVLCTLLLLPVLGGASRGRPDGERPRVPGQWQAQRLGELRVPMVAQLVEGLRVVLGFHPPGRALWPGFDLSTQCIVIEFASLEQESHVAMGECGGTPGTLLVGAAPRARNLARERSIRRLAADALGLQASRSVLLVSLPQQGMSGADVLDTLLFVVHEAFHLSYQFERSLSIPGERAIPAWMGDAPVKYRGSARDYLEGAYPRQEGVARLLDKERAYLRAALATALEEKGAGHFPRTIAAIDEVFGVMAERTAAGGRLETSESSWELDEGVATNLERRAVLMLRQHGRDPGPAPLLTMIFEGSAGESTAAIPFFLVHGALKAALLDEMTGWAEWPAIVYPGRPGEGRSLNEVLLHYRNKVNQQVERAR